MVKWCKDSSKILCYMKVTQNFNSSENPFFLHITPVRQFCCGLIPQSIHALQKFSVSTPVCNKRFCAKKERNKPPKHTVHLFKISIQDLEIFFPNIVLKNV